MPDSKIFCNAPWYELHIYWDGSLGFCCQESHKLYADHNAEKYNLKSMTIKQWFDSAPMRRARLGMLDTTQNSFCSKCYTEEQFNQSSRRHRSNQKSVIFTKGNFEQSFEQSPNFDTFKYSADHEGAYNNMPVDLHIDLGNFCNLQCKMCNPSASSGIASQYVQWGIESAKKYVGTDWTRDQDVWERTVEEIIAIPNLKNVHFMGGETLITKKFEEFVDSFVAAKKFNVGFSFVTNGTTFNESLLEKLKKFRRVGIEISVETMTEHNRYQRQGTNNTELLQNINRYLDYCNNTNITVTMRPAISLLTIGYYHTLLEFCLEKKLVIKSLLCNRPRYFDTVILPQDVKQLYLERYLNFLQKHYKDYKDTTEEDYNESDPNESARIIYQQAMMCIELLKTPTPKDSEVKLAEMVYWCKKWDSVYKYNAHELYPEFSEILNRYGY